MCYMNLLHTFNYYISINYILILIIIITLIITNNYLIPSHMQLNKAVDAKQISSDGSAVIPGLKPGLLLWARPSEELQHKREVLIAPSLFDYVW